MDRTETDGLPLYAAHRSSFGRTGKTMRNYLIVASLLVLVFLSAGNASADNNFGLGIKAGTLGLGVEGRWKPLPLVDFRIGTNFYEYDDDGAQAGIDYDATLELDTVYLTANFHIPLSPFRVTAGAFSNNNEVRMVGFNSANFNIGGVDYSAAEVGTLSSVTSFASTSPYLGIGLDFELFGKAGLNFDLGVLWQGDPEVTLEATGLAVGLSDFQTALEAERLQLEDEMSDLKAWPVISLSFIYNF